MFPKVVKSCRDY